MTPEAFFEQFGTIADAPNGVEKLRELILSLAVRGQLTDRSSSDQPGRQVLDAIEVDRAQLIVKKKLRRQKKRPELPQIDPTPPNGWLRCYLGDVFDLEYGKSLPKKVRCETGSIPVYGSNGVVGNHDAALIDKAGIVVGRKGSSGAVVDTTGPFWPIDTAYFVIPRGGMSIQFSSILLRSANLGALDRSTAIPGLNREDAYVQEVLLPPLAEQRRIVAKVDELMALCDQLETRQQKRGVTRGKLVASALDALQNAEAADAFQDAWDRVRTHWDLLTDHPDSIGPLRQAILQLAVRGKLVEQDPGDEPASELIETTATLRGQLYKDKKIPKPKPVVDINDNDVPFDLPDSWSWCRIDQLCTHIVDCLHRTPKYVDEGIPAIRTCDVEPGKLLVDQARKVSEETYAEQTRRLVPRSGDVFYSREGGRYGVAAVVPEDVKVCLSQRMMQFRCAPGIDPEYLAAVLNAPVGFAQAEADVGGSASPHVNIASIRKFVFPLPPSAEQMRIVSRFKELMSLCDELSRSLQESVRQSERYAAAAVTDLSA